MISWTPAALVFYQRYCCINLLQKKHPAPLPNTEESLPNPAVVAIASTGRLNCPSHLSSCNKPCCDNISCKCNKSCLIASPSKNTNTSLCCFQQVLSNCDISSCCCIHSCCYSWLTGRRKRYIIDLNDKSFGALHLCYFDLFWANNVTSFNVIGTTKISFGIRSLHQHLDTIQQMGRIQ